MQAIPDLIACEECDAIHTRPALGHDEIALCRRCGGELERDMRAHSRHALPLAVAALFMYVVANVFPIMEIELHGISSQTTLIGSALSMNAKGMPLVASLVFTTTIALPLIQLLALIYLLICVSRRGKPAGFNFMVRMIQTFRPWIMVEILLLGAIVSFVKLTNMATVTPGPALWALGALTLLLASVFSFDPKYIWRMSLRRNKGNHAMTMNRTRMGRSLGKAARAKAP
jgi:paraquat-inducible protein A